MKLFQGPLADVLTHIGQLASQRRLCGEPVPPQKLSTPLKFTSGSLDLKKVKSSLITITVEVFKFTNPVAQLLIPILSALLTASIYMEL